MSVAEKQVVIAAAKAAHEARAQGRTKSPKERSGRGELITAGVVTSGLIGFIALAVATQ